MSQTTAMQPGPTDEDGTPTRKPPHWTDTYNKWEGWQDPDEVAKKREEEEKRAKSFRENNMACAHDRSAERKIMDMPIADKLSACRDFRRRGNMYHAEGQYRRGALQYRQALIYYDFCFPDDESQQQELDDIRQVCLLNSAACFLACGELDQTLDCCYQALREEPDNVKALYRRAVVYRLRDQFKEASTDLRRALAQRPHDVMLRKESAVLKSKIASYREGSKAMGAHFFPNYHGGGHEDADDDAATVSPPNPSEFMLPASEIEGRGMVHGEGKEWGGGRYVVADGTASASFGEGDQEGVRRHDLLLPVCVDVSQLEAMAGCAWVVDA